MRKILFPSLFLILSFIVVLLFQAFMPTYTGMSIFFFFFLVCEGYLWFSVRQPISKLKPGLRILVALLFWLPTGLILCLLGYGLFVPFLEWNLQIRTYLLSCILVIYLAECFPILTLALADLFRMGKFTVLRLISGKNITMKSIPRVKPIMITGWIMGALFFITLTAGMVFWQFDFKVRQQTIILTDLPQKFDGLKIVQFSDVHLGSWGSKHQLQEAMDKMNALHPDVIFFTGDMFNYRTADGKGFQGILQTLRAPFGVYAIMGNHDYGDYITWPSAASKKRNFNDCKTFYKKLGWKLLLNSNDILKRGTDSIAIIGVENWGATRRFQRYGDLGKAQLGTETMAIQLLLSHDPSYWDSIVSKKYPKVDVTFSGHTHGGQIGIDCCHLHWSPITWISRLWCGLYKNPNPDPVQYLYVNQGLGNIGYSGRVGILPEITLVTLKRR